MTAVAESVEKKQKVDDDVDVKDEAEATSDDAATAETDKEPPSADKADVCSQCS